MSPTSRRPAPIRFYAALAATALTVGVWAFFTDAGGFQVLACRIPGLSERCGDYGWGGVGSPEQDAAWAAAGQRDDGDPLRAYLERWPNGAYAPKARARLARCKPVEVEVWRPATRRLALAIGMGPQPFPSEAAARADALERGERDAVGVCAGMRMEPTFRLLAASPTPIGWRCQRGPAGQSCGFEGEVACSIEIRRVDSHEVCRP